MVPEAGSYMPSTSPKMTATTSSSASEDSRASTTTMATASTAIRARLAITMVRLASSRSAYAPPISRIAARGIEPTPITRPAPAGPATWAAVQARPMNQATSPTRDSDEASTHAMTRASRRSGGMVGQTAVVMGSRPSGLGGNAVGEDEHVARRPGLGLALRQGGVLREQVVDPPAELGELVPG